MSTRNQFAALTIAAALLSFSAPASAQMWFFPDYAVPSAMGTPAAFVAATYGRGLNEASGKLDAVGLVAGKTGETVSFMGGVGRASADGESETTLGGAVGFDVVRGASATISVQGGIGWFSVDVFGETLTSLRFPIGVAVKGAIQTSSATVVPWVMPRLNVVRVSAGGVSDSATDLGASGGLTFNFSGGFGVHTALDVLLANSKMVHFGVGAHYVLGGGGAN